MARISSKRAVQSALGLALFSLLCVTSARAQDRDQNDRLGKGDFPSERSPIIPGGPPPSAEDRQPPLTEDGPPFPRSPRVPGGPPPSEEERQPPLTEDHPPFPRSPRVPDGPPPSNEERQPPLAAGQPLDVDGHAPELNLGSLGSALALLGGGYYVITARRRRAR
jgi:hypothetical protein